MEQIVKSNDDGSMFPIQEHPIIKDTAILPTRALEEFVNILAIWLDNLLPGGIVWGIQRAGKTQAIRYFIANSEMLLNNMIPCTLFSIWEATNSSITENRFFEGLLKALGYSLFESGTGGKKRTRAIEFMTEQANEKHEHRYLLFIDEAQWLATCQLKFLMDLHNQLKLADIRLITILVGQPELMELKTNMKSNKKHKHLLGRFMTADHQFEGIVGVSDFRKLTNALDLGSEYPSGSNCSYTQYFLPKAFNAGFRFSNYADSIWDTLLELCRSEGIKKFNELPMQPLSALIRYLLRELSHNDSTMLELNKVQIETAIINSALIQIDDLT